MAAEYTDFKTLSRVGIQEYRIYSQTTDFKSLITVATLPDHQNSSTHWRRLSGRIILWMVSCMLCLVLKTKKKLFSSQHSKQWACRVCCMLCTIHSFSVFLLGWKHWCSNGDRQLNVSPQLPSCHCRTILGGHQVHQLSHKLEQNSQHLLCTFIHCCLPLAASPHIHYWVNLSLF